MLNNVSRFYKIGGIVFRIDMPGFHERDDLKLFRTDERQADYTYVFEMTDTLEVPDGECLFSDGTISHYQTENGMSRVFFDERGGGVYLVEHPDGCTRNIFFDQTRAEYLNSSLVFDVFDIPSRLIKNDGILLHAAFIEINGEAVLFTGQKQIGKSTQAALWKNNRGARIINGDRAIIRRKNGKWYAWGTPYCGTSNISLNCEFPLKTIVILSQSEKNAVKSTSVKDSFKALLDGASFETWNKEQVETMSRTCSGIISEIPFYSLACTPDVRAIIALEEILCRVEM